MSGSGQYQFICTVGVPSCRIYVSNDYGENWTLRLTENTNNSEQWIQAVCCDITGQYVSTADGGISGNNNNYWSNNYGVSFIKLNSSVNATRTGITINNSTLVTYSIAGQNQGPKAIFKATLTDTSPSETSVFTLPNAGQWITSNGGNQIFYTTTSTQGFYSSDGGTSFGSALTLPDNFVSVWYNAAGTQLWAASSTTIYYSKNNGTSWQSISTSLTDIYGFTISSDNTLLYLMTYTSYIYSMNISAY